MQLDPVVIATISDLFINLSAGWIGAAIIIPANTQSAGKIRFVMLTTNFFFATVSLLIAYLLRKQI